MKYFTDSCIPQKLVLDRVKEFKNERVKDFFINHFKTPGQDETFIAGAE